jgi:hypothetical protein
MIVWVLTSLTLIYPSKISAGLLVIVGGWMALQTFAYHASGTAGGLGKIASYADQKIKRSADKMVLKVRHAIPCDKSNWKSFDWFATDEENGTLVPNMWYMEADGQKFCFDGPGHDSLFGRELKPVTEQIVLLIREQEPIPTPAPQVAALPAPPTPLPSPDIEMGPAEHFQIKDSDPQ